MSNPIYDDLSRERNIDVPERRPSPWPPGELPEIPERPDGSWCEDRTPGEGITDDDGVE